MPGSWQSMPALPLEGCVCPSFRWYSGGWGAWGWVPARVKPQEGKRIGSVGKGQRRNLETYCVQRLGLPTSEEAGNA